MIRGLHLAQRRKTRVPHERGDDPQFERALQSTGACSPQSWGCSAIRRREIRCTIAFPTGASVVKANLIFAKIRPKKTAVGQRGFGARVAHPTFCARVGFPFTFQSALAR